MPIFRPSLKYSTKYAMRLIAVQPSRSGLAIDEAVAASYTKLLENVVDMNFDSAHG